MNNLLKNKWIWIIGGLILLMVISVVTYKDEKDSVSEIVQPQYSQEQQNQKDTQKESNKIHLENCLNEANIWFDQSKQTAIETLEEEKKTSNPHQKFIDQHASSIDEITNLLLEELEEYKTDCYEKYL